MLASRRSSPPLTAAVAASPPAPRGRRAFRIVALIGLVVSVPYVGLLIWNAVQYFQTPPGFANFGLLPSAVRLPGVGLPVEGELAIALAMLIVFIASLALLPATRSQRALAAIAATPTPGPPATPDATDAEDATTTPGVAPAHDASAADEAALDSPAPAADALATEHHRFTLPMPPLPDVPPAEAALLVPTASDTDDAPAGSPFPPDAPPDPLPSQGRGSGG